MRNTIIHRFKFESRLESIHILFFISSSKMSAKDYMNTEMETETKPIPPHIPENPFFPEFPNKIYSDTLLNNIYAFSQLPDTTATVRTSSIPDEHGHTPTIDVTGFRTILSFLLVKHLDLLEQVFVTPTITILGESFMYKKHATYEHALNRIENNSFIGITNFDTYRAAYNAQLAKQNILDKDVLYSNAQKAEIQYLESERSELYNKFKNNTNKVTRKINKVNKHMVYPVGNYYLFSNSTREHFIRSIHNVMHHSKNKVQIIVIPLKIVPFDYSDSQMVTSHAQYILIHITRKMYTIIDPQFENTAHYTKLIDKELRRIDPFITECMGEQFEPYRYNIPCPQSVIQDKNCIWWSLLIMYVYIKSDPNTVDYQLLLKHFAKMSQHNPQFYFHLISSFKTFIFESVIMPMIRDGTVTWKAMSMFLAKQFPEFSNVPVNTISSRLLDAKILRVHPGSMNIHGKRMIPRFGGPAVIIPMKPMGGTRKKLTSKTYAKKRTHKHRNGKHTRKSYRR